MNEERIQIPRSPGQAPRIARVQRPVGPIRAWALMIHCFDCAGEHHAARHLTEALTSRGLGVVRMDLTGEGEGQERTGPSTLSSIEDLIGAAEWLRSQGMGPDLLVGHSLGGAAVIAAAARLDEVSAVVTISARITVDADVEEAHDGSQVGLVHAGRALQTDRESFEALRKQALLESLRGLRRPLLVLHAPLDPVVGVEQAREVFVAAWHPKSFISLDTADHHLSNPADARYVGGIIAAWVERFLPVEVAAEPERADVPRDGVDVVIGDSLRVEVRAGPHRFVADEPRSLGGTDEGPTPYDLLLGALGACTAMTLRMYANRKEWALEQVDVHLEHARTRRDGERHEEILVRLGLTGDLDEAQRDRLLEIAQRCPVHRTLTGSLALRTERGG